MKIETFNAIRAISEIAAERRFDFVQKGNLQRMKTWHGKVENCDLCGAAITKTFVDGRFSAFGRTGPWALMCPSCHKSHGVGFGVGRGQHYTNVEGVWTNTKEIISDQST